MKKKLFKLLYFLFASVFAINGYGQKNLFLKQANNNLIYSISYGGWIRFQPNTAYDETTIFTEGKALFGLTVHYSMRLIKSHVDELGYGHFKFNQTYNDIDITGGEYIIHTRNNKLYSGNGYIYTPQHIQAQQIIKEADALNKILKQLDEKLFYWNIDSKEQRIKKRSPGATYYPKATLTFLPSVDEKSMVLCYSFFIATLQPGKYGYYYINAQTGALEKFISAAYTCDNALVTTAFYGAKSIFTNDVAVIGHSYDLEDDCQASKYGVYDVLNNTIFNTSDNNWNSTGVLRSAATSLYSIKTAYKWFKNVFNRNGHGNSDDDLDILQGWDFGGAHPGNNAAYYPDPIPFSVDDVRIGLGDTPAQEDDYNALDILAHEFTHGVTHNEANLTYESESGALNESFSDIFAEWVEHNEFGSNNWLIGWDRIVDDAHHPIRSLAHPHSPSFQDPDRINGDYWINTVGCVPTHPPGPNNDACGVHKNSSVQNHMFYLLTEGGNGWTNDATSDGGSNTGSNPYQWSVTGIGIDKAIRIAYKVLCDFLVSSSNYNDSRNAWVHAASDIFGECSVEAIQTGKAWDAVGIHPPVVNLITALCIDYGNTPVVIRKNGVINVANGCTVNIQPTGNYVNFEATNAVKFYSGFRAIAGSNFRAGINDCSFAAF